MSFRLTSAGFNGQRLFTRSAVRLLYRASGGVPRLINVIAHKAMLSAYGQASHSVTRRHMVSAIRDTAESRKLGSILAKRDFWLWPGLAALAAGALVFAPGLVGVW